MEAEEREYHERLARARKKEATMKKMLQRRAIKRQVCVTSQIRRFYVVNVSIQKLTHSNDDDPQLEDSFLPDDESDREHDNIDPKLRELMQK